MAKRRKERPARVRQVRGLSQADLSAPWVQELIKRAFAEQAAQVDPRTRAALDRLKPLPGSQWTAEQLRNYVLGEARSIASPSEGFKSVPPSKQARGYRREGRRWKRLARDHSEGFEKYLALAADWSEAARCVRESSASMRGTARGNDRRHGIHIETYKLLQLFSFLKQTSGSARYRELAAIFTAEGWPVSAAALRAIASRHGLRTRR